jgi:uncharacterized protein YmfQ (DUF2313 family)
MSPDAQAPTAQAGALCGMTPADYLAVLGDLLPRGAAWPRDPETVLMRFFGAAADEWARIHGRDCALIAEAYPCGSHELLAEWERVLGLPDACLEDLAATEAMRQAAVCAKLGEVGGQSISYFVTLAARWGFTVSITDGPPLAPHHWTITVSSKPVAHVTVGCWRIGEPRCTLLEQEVLECIIRRAAPAHTVPDFSYRLQRRGWDRAVWNQDAWT